MIRPASSRKYSSVAFFVGIRREGGEGGWDGLALDGIRLGWEEIDGRNDWDGIRPLMNK